MQENPKLLVPDHLKNLDRRRIFNDGKGDDWKPILFYIKEDGERVPLVAKEELMVVAGEKKARKSLLLSAIAASRFEFPDPNSCLRFELFLSGQSVLWFDTEQPRGRVKSNRWRYQKLIGKQEDPELYHYALRGLSPHQMKDAILHVAQTAMTTDRPPGLIMIDQIVDLSTSRDENDKVASVEVVDFLTLLSDLTGALMLISIHSNRLGTHTNGKIGSFLDQKTDCTFMLKLNEHDDTELVHMYSREKKMPGIVYTHGEYALPKFISEKGAKVFFD